MSAKKMSEPNENPNINFLQRFVSKNYERRELDEQTCNLFIHFLILFNEGVNKETNAAEIKTIVKIVSSVFQNFEELNRSRQAFQFLQKLIGVSLNLIEKVFRKGEKSIAIDSIDLFWPLFDPEKKEEKLSEVQKLINKMSFPKNMKNVEVVSKQKQLSAYSLPYEKQELINTFVYDHFKNDSMLVCYLQSFLNIEGTNYLDIILDMIVYCINENKRDQFRKLLRIYKYLGQSDQQRIQNISFLVNKINRSPKKVYFFEFLCEQIQIEKYYSGNDLLAIFLNILDTIFEEGILNSHSLYFFKKMNALKYSFKAVSGVNEKMKLSSIPYKILKVLINGKKSEEKKKNDEKKNVGMGTSEQKKPSLSANFNKLLSKPRSEQPEGLFIIDGDEQKQKVLIELLKKAQPEESFEKQIQFQGNDSIEGEFVPLKNEQVQRYSQILKQIFQSLLKNKTICSILKQGQNQKIIELLSIKKQIYNKKIIEFVTSVFSQILEINYKDLELKSPLIQLVALKTIESKFGKENGSEKALMDLYQSAHKSLIKEDGLNYHFMVCHILHRCTGDTHLIIHYLLENSSNCLNFDSLSELSINLSLIVSCLEPIANLRFTTQKLTLNISKLSEKFSLDQYFLDDEKENKLFIARQNPAEIDDKQNELFCHLSEIVSKTNRLIDTHIDKLSSMTLTSFYKIIVELNTLCKEKGEDKFSESKMLDAVKKMRNNNKFSMFLTLNNQLRSELQNYLTLAKENCSSMTMILHLLKKGELLFENNSDKNNVIDKGQLKQTKSTLLMYLEKIGSSPSKKLLQLVNETYENELNLTQKNEMLFSLIKDFKMIKFYSQTIKSKEVLQLLTLKIGLKIYELMDKECEQQMKDENIQRRVRKLSLLYNNQNKKLNQKQKKVSQIYTKIKLLTISDKNQEETSLIKNIVEMLESNHQVLGQILVREQEEVMEKEGEQWLFDEKTGLMGYLLETLIHSLNTKSEISLLLLNMLKTIIENNSNIMRITQDEIKKKLTEKNLSSLIIDRTVEGVKLVKQKKKENQKQVQQYLEQSQKMYSILGKISNLSQIQPNIILEKIVELDEVDNSIISLYLLRELVNISQIMHNLSLTSEKEDQITDIIFTYLMKLKEIYPDEAIPHPIDPEEIISISSVVIWFIYEFYALEKETQEKNSPVSNRKNASGSCLLNKKTTSFFCLSCNQDLQLCINCAIACHENHAVLNNQGNYQNSKFCQCRESGVCKFNVKKSNNRPSKNPFIYGDPSDALDGRGLLKSSNEMFIDMERERQKIKSKYERKMVGLYDDDQGYDVLPPQYLQEELGFERDLMPPQPNWRQVGMSFDEFMKSKGRNEGRPDRELFKFEKARLVQQEDMKEKKVPEKIQRQQEGEQAIMQEESYKQPINMSTECQIRKHNTLSSQSYLLPIVMSMTLQICEQKEKEQSEKKQEVIYQIKLDGVPGMNNKICAISWKVCNNGSFLTKLRKPDGGVPTSPSISKHLITVSEKHLVIASGLNLNVYLKDKIYSSVNEVKSTTGLPIIAQQSIQYEVHSVQFMPSNSSLLCVSGIHHLCIYELQSDGNINRHPISKYNVASDNINKIKVIKLGILVGVSKEIRLLSSTLKPMLTIQSQNSLIKEWNVYQKSSAQFIVYVLLTDGYIYYVEITPWTDGIISVSKKLVDGRMNRPVGAYVQVKDIKGAGTLVFAGFKDKNIGHTFARLEGVTLKDTHYFKFLNQGLHNLFDTDYVMGMTDFIENPTNPNELFIIANVIPPLPDILSIHRGFLVMMKVQMDKPNSKPEIQIVNQESRCEYFQIIRMGEKAFFILSIHEDGSLHITTPVKIPKAYCEVEIKQLREKTQLQHKKNHNNEQSSNEAQIETLKYTIKNVLTLKHLKQSISEHSINNYQFVEQSEQLKHKQDYNLLQLFHRNSTTHYEVQLNNSNKIITGMVLPSFGDVKILTRTIKNVMEFGLTVEESLYFYAFGTIHVEFIKNQANCYERDNHAEGRKKKRGDRLIEDMIRFDGRDRNFAPGFLDRNIQQQDKVQIVAYGENFQNFKSKINNFDDRFNCKKKFNLSQGQNICRTIKVTEIFLDNVIATQNYITSQDQIVDFITTLREKLIVMKKKQELANRIYQNVRNVLIKSLTIYETLEGRKLHIFNDEFHPMRYATEKKIDHLYECLKTEITDRDLTTLVGLLFEFCQTSPHLLAYYVARYPAMLLKLQKRLKPVDKEALIDMLVPVSLLAYLVMKYLNYHVDWILTDVCQIVGKPVKDPEGESDPRPSYRRRRLLFQYLDKHQDWTPEAWVKNVEAVDAHEASSGNQPSNPKDGGSMLGNPLMGGNPMMNNQSNLGDLMYYDEEAQLKLVLEMSMKQMEIQPQFEVQDEMQPQISLQKVESSLNISSILLKDLITECLKDIDYNTNALDVNCAKVIVIYVISKIVNKNYEQSKDSSSFVFLCSHIKNVMIKLCAEYQAPGNTTIQGILMLWMKLFGNVYENSLFFREIQEKNESFEPYENVKEEVLKTIKKIPIEDIKKNASLPNPLARLFKGLKITTNLHFIYGFIFVLQYPCEANYVLFTLDCYWLFPKNKQFYTKTKYRDTINEGIRLGNIQKICDVARNSIETWKEMGQDEITWLQEWIENKKENWQLGLELMAMYYE